MKISTMVKRLNTVLQKNLKKPDKKPYKAIYIKGFKEFRDCKTKIYNDAEYTCFLISDFLKEQYTNTSFRVEKQRQQTYKIMVTSLSPQDYGIEHGCKDSFAIGYQTLGYVKLKEEKAVLGYYDNGMVEYEKFVPEIIMKDDVDLTKVIKEEIRKRVKLMREAEERRAKKANK